MNERKISKKKEVEVGKKDERTLSSLMMRIIVSKKKVKRYSALGLGVVYGFSHRRSLQKSSEKKEAAEKFVKTEKLIAEAKEEFAKLNKKPSEGSSDLSKIDLDDKSLDFAKVILSSVEALK